MTPQEKAELLIAGIEAAGLDVDTELARIEAVPRAADRALAIQEFQLAGLGARQDQLGGLT